MHSNSGNSFKKIINGDWDLGEEFIDCGVDGTGDPICENDIAWDDTYGNGTWDDGEEFIDGIWEAIEGNLMYRVYLDSGENLGRIITIDYENSRKEKRPLYTIKWENKKLRRILKRPFHNKQHKDAIEIPLNHVFKKEMVIYKEPQFLPNTYGNYYNFTIYSQKEFTKI